MGLRIVATSPARRVGARWGTRPRKRSARRGFLILGVAVLLIYSTWTRIMLPFLCETRREASSRVIWRTDKGRQQRQDSGRATNAAERTRRGHAFQVIVLTYARSGSLVRLLGSVRAARYDGDAADLHVWVDRSAEDGHVDEATIGVAREFEWPHGEFCVHVWDRHVGIWGQWVDSYRPVGEDDFGVLLEDDLEVSPLYYLWLRGARKAYGARDDVFGYTLQRGTLRANQTGFGRRRIAMDEGEKAFLYRLVGSWGYAPETRAWRDFRTWFHEKSCERGFRPVVSGLVPSKWYEKQEGKRSMWTMWHIRFAHERGLLTVYANLGRARTLAASWREPGLHFGRGGNARRASAVKGVRDFEVLSEDSDGGADVADEAAGRFVFPAEPRRMDWNGTYVTRGAIRTTQ